MVIPTRRQGISWSHQPGHKTRAYPDRELRARLLSGHLTSRTKGTVSSSPTQQSCQERRDTAQNVSQRSCQASSDLQASRHGCRWAGRIITAKSPLACACCCSVGGRGKLKDREWAGPPAALHHGDHMRAARELLASHAHPAMGDIHTPE